MDSCQPEMMMLQLTIMLILEILINMMGVMLAFCSESSLILGVERMILYDQTQQLKCFRFENVRPHFQYNPGAGGSLVGRSPLKGGGLS